MCRRERERESWIMISDRDSSQGGRLAMSHNRHSAGKGLLGWGQFSRRMVETARESNVLIITLHSSRTVLNEDTTGWAMRWKEEQDDDDT